MNVLRLLIISAFRKADWVLVSATVILAAFGLVTMYSFEGTENYFNRQAIALGIGLCVYFILALGDYRFLKSTKIVVGVYGGVILLLLGLFVFGFEAKGSQSWFRIAGFSFQPADFAKIALIVILAKYFTRRHIEIKRIRHILVSGAYAFILFALIVLQPDFGSAMIIFFIWLGMVLVAGISYKHLLIIFTCGALAFGGAWFFVFKDYQKERIKTFINPLADIRGAGYNAYQSMIAVGSGQVLGKGVGYGTQSRLQYLPEHQTDFIFASFAEEWGLVGVVMVYILFAIIFWRLLLAAYRGASNFETLFALGGLIFFGVHVTINIGMNMGMLPVTGVPLPFMSYGGSHLLSEYVVLGIVAGMRSYERTVRQDMLQNQPELLFEVKR